jgi:hypothetical protein
MSESQLVSQLKQIALFLIQVIEQQLQNLILFVMNYSKGLGGKNENT